MSLWTTDRLIEKGRDEAWEAIKKLYLPVPEGGLPDEAIREIFGAHNWIGIVRNFSASEVVEKIRAYEEKQKENSEFHIGDEVQNDNGARGVVVGSIKNPVDGSEFISVFGMGEDYEVPQIMLKEDYKKTGRHFPEIVEVLKKLQEGE